MRIGTFIKASLTVAALALGVAMTSSSVQAQNVLTNPGFESASTAGGDVAGAPGWGTFNSVFTSSAVAPHSGSNELKIFGPFENGGGAGATQDSPALPGQTWQASVFARNDSSDPMGVNNFFVAQLRFLNGTSVINGAGGDSIQFSSANSTPNTWTQLSTAQFVAPAGTTAARIILVHVQLDPIDGGSVWLDDAALTKIVPEPTSLAMLGLGAMGLIARRRRA